MTPAAQPESPSGLPGPSLAVVELESIARGYVVADQMVKAAAVDLLFVEAVTPGKLVILYAGGEAEVEIAHAAALSSAGEHLLDQLLLTRAHPDVLDVLNEPRRRPGDALGILECRTVAAGLVAADAAAKTTPAQLMEIHPARGIGGKTVVLLTGSVADVEASLDAGAGLAEARRGLVNRALIPGTHPDLKVYLARRQGRVGL